LSGEHLRDHRRQSVGHDGIGQDRGECEGACEVHNPGYDFNDAALPYGAAFFVRLVEKKLGKTGA